MALTTFQRQVCQILSKNRIKNGESYIAGGVALNTWLSAPRQSHDIDLFHDTQEALEKTWQADNLLLKNSGYTVNPILERPSYVEASVEKGSDQVLIQWVRDSAFRFFPLVEHPDLGLTLHPFDLATNKVLALAGRLEVRDWIDLIQCGDRLQPLGYLMWAASGKDEGLSPVTILEEAKRSSHYTKSDLELLAFEENQIPDLKSLSLHWKKGLIQAKEILELLPEESAGTCVLTLEAQLFSGDAEILRKALKSKKVRFHPGCIQGAFPQIKSR